MAQILLNIPDAMKDEITKVVGLREVSKFIRDAIAEKLEKCDKIKILHVLPPS